MSKSPWLLVFFWAGRVKPRLLLADEKGQIVVQPKTRSDHSDHRGIQSSRLAKPQAGNDPTIQFLLRFGDARFRCAPPEQGTNKATVAHSGAAFSGLSCVLHFFVCLDEMKQEFTLITSILMTINPNSNTILLLCS